MKNTILLMASLQNGQYNTIVYTISAVIAVFILGYLIFALVKPEKF